MKKVTWDGKSVNSIADLIKLNPATLNDMRDDLLKAAGFVSTALNYNKTVNHRHCGSHKNTPP